MGSGDTSSLKPDDLTYRDDLIFPGHTDRSDSEGLGGTHGVCDLVLKVMGGKARCCDCTGHDCDGDFKKFGGKR